MLEEIMSTGVSEATARAIIDDLSPLYKGKIEKKVPVEVYSRVVGYFRPITHWNPGKQEEFRDRVTYKIPA